MTPEEASANFLEFNNRLEIINNNTSEEDKKRIHYKSLRNFIYHYNSSRKGKTKCTELLREYLESIEKQNYYFTEDQSKAAYDFYIGPLAQDFYSRYVNFSADFSIISFVLLLGIPVYFAWIIFASKIILIAMLVIYFIYYVNYFLKYSSKKIYGYRY